MEVLNFLGALGAGFCFVRAYTRNQTGWMIIFGILIAANMYYVVR